MKTSSLLIVNDSTDVLLSSKVQGDLQYVKVRKNGNRTPAILGQVFLSVSGLLHSIFGNSVSLIMSLNFKLAEGRATILY